MIRKKRSKRKSVLTAFYQHKNWLFCIVWLCLSVLFVTQNTLILCGTYRRMDNGRNHSRRMISLFSCSVASSKGSTRSRRPQSRRPESFPRSLPKNPSSRFSPITIRFGQEAGQPVRLPSISCLSYNKRSNWLTNFSLGLYVRSKDCQPSSCCSVRFKQVEPTAMPGSSCHPID